MVTYKATIRLLKLSIALKFRHTKVVTYKAEIVTISPIYPEAVTYKAYKP